MYVYGTIKDQLTPLLVAKSQELKVWGHKAPVLFDKKPQKLYSWNREPI